MERQTKSIRISQDNINLNLDGITTITDIKRKHKQIEYIDGSEGELYVSFGKSIEISLNYVNPAQYSQLREIWKSKKPFLLYTETNKIFRVRFLNQEFVLTKDEDFDGNVFYFGLLEARG